MKTFKQKEHGLFIRPVGIGGRIYLSAAVMYYFDLDNPEAPLKEKEMWSDLQDLMGQGFVLDQGVPKVRPEVLVTGSCFAPKGETRQAERVRIKVGKVEKDLSVFGDRHFHSAGAITDPAPFSEMEISLKNAYGGKGVEENPYGKGACSVTLPDGSKVHPLPNVENPGHLMGSPGDRPHPAATGPLPVDIPPRSKRSGTFDERWKRERWPYFPDDFDYGHFNAAPRDQWAKDFFEGGEAVEVENMHPERRRIESKLPTLKPRLFVTKKASLHASEDGEVFVETLLKLETVWLFPSILRGLVMFRGMAEILDDEYADLVRLFIVSERADQAPGSLQHYRDESLKAASRLKPSRPEPLAAGAEQRKQADRMIARLPQLLKMARLKAMGRAPAPTTPTDAGLAKGRAVLDQAEKTLDDLQAQMTEMKAQYGHFARIEPRDLDRYREDIREARAAADDAGQEFQATMQKAGKAKAEASAFIKENANPQALEVLKQSGFDPEDPTKALSGDPWHDRGFPLVEQWRLGLEFDSGLLARLQSLGLSPLGAGLAWLGVVAEPRTERAADWGMDGDEEFTLPAGLAMPRFTDGKLTSLRIRPGREVRELADGSKDVMAPGSSAQPLFIEGPAGAPVMVVGDELEARAVADQAGDLCSVLVLSSPGEALPDEAADALKTAAGVFKSLPAESAEGVSDWEKKLPGVKALRWPEGANALEARLKGVDLREVLDPLWPPAGGAGEQEEALAVSPKPPPGVDGLEGLGDEIKQHIQSVLPFKPGEDASVSREALLKRMQAGLEKDGVENPGPLLRRLAAEPQEGLAESGRAAAREYEAVIARLREVDELSPDEEADLRRAARDLEESTSQAEKDFAALDKRAGEAAKEPMAAIPKAGEKVEVPKDLKDKLLEGGLDPDKLQQNTRKDAETLLASGGSFAGVNFQGADLSGLDLSGQDFTLTLLGGANLKGCRLDGALFKQTLAQKADFAGASLKGAKLESALFLGARMAGADLAGAEMHQAMLKKADLAKAVLRGVKLHLGVLEGAVLEDADFRDADLLLVLLNRANAQRANFRGARLERCMFKSAALAGADFSGAALPSTIFLGEGCGGENITFAGSDLDKSRMGDGASLPGADFTGASLKQAYFKGSNLSGANFDGAVLDEAMMEHCDLSLANLRRVPAKKARFNRCNLEQADMRSVNLMLGSLRKSRLVGCDLTAANLFGADVFKAVFGETRLDRAQLGRTLIDKRTDLIK